jgi:hypothetical protein
VLRQLGPRRVHVIHEHGEHETVTGRGARDRRRRDELGSGGHVAQADVMFWAAVSSPKVSGRPRAYRQKDLVPARSPANRLMTFTRASGRFMSAMTKPGPELIGPGLVNRLRGHRPRRRGNRQDLDEVLRSCLTIDLA